MNPEPDLKLWKAAAGLTGFETHRGPRQKYTRLTSTAKPSRSISQDIYRLQTDDFDEPEALEAAV